MTSKGLRPKLNEITCLYEITKAIHSTMDLTKVLYKVLDLLAENLGMNRGSITLLNPDTSEINIEVAHGISSMAKTKGRYKLGEGITGRVIESGRPMAVPHLDQEPLFLDRTGTRSRIDKSKISFICVPIKEGRRVIGALSADRIFEGPSPLDEDIRLLTIISSLIAQKAALLEKIKREKEKLTEEIGTNQRPVLGAHVLPDEIPVERDVLPDSAEEVQPQVAQGVQNLVGQSRIIVEHERELLEPQKLPWCTEEAQGQVAGVDPFTRCLRLAAEIIPVRGKATRRLRIKPLCDLLPGRPVFDGA